MTDKEKIIAKVNTIANITAYDTNTYIWARTTPTYLKNKYKENYTLGGGNIISTGYIFNAINFLAKVHNILNSSRRIFSDQTSIDNYLELKGDLEKVKLWGKARYFIKKPHLGEINEKESFIRLCQGIDLKNILIIPEEWKNDKNRLGDVWDNWRNKISHMGVQSKGSSSTLDLKYPKTGKSLRNYTKIKDFINSCNEIAITDNRITVEFLVRDIQKIAKYIENLIISKSKTSFEILELIDWIEMTDSEDFYYSLIY